MEQVTVRSTVEQALETLGLERSASDQSIRAAYLAKVRQFPPDRAPEQFEQVRLAYERLSDPAWRDQYLLEEGLPLLPLENLLSAGQAACHRVGPKPWLDLLGKERGR